MMDSPHLAPPTAAEEPPSEPEAPVAPAASSSLGRAWREVKATVLYAVQVMIVVMLILHFVGRVSIVQGGSMEPSIVTGERIIVNLLIYRFAIPQRGDVIVFQNPRDITKDYIKRIVGLPGETVEIRAGVTFLNGRPLDEPYVTLHDYSDLPPVRLQEKELFVMGDNRANSEDSRRWGPLSMELVRGKASVVFWPPERVSHLP